MKTWTFIKSINPHLASLTSLVAGLFFVLLSAFLIWKNTNNFPLAVPLWFSKPWGEERLAEPILLWLLPLASLATIIINFSLSRIFREKERVLFLLLIWSIPVVSGLLFYTLLEIIFVAT
ncbi:MAG TPA: hypothetical protein VF303_02030 [Candidatus Nanoarchaeia archaeon]